MHLLFIFKYLNYKEKRLRAEINFLKMHLEFLLLVAIIKNSKKIKNNLNC